jgi:3-hydroxyisobutyrate dehydrogenase
VPVLNAMGREIVYLGPTGSGARMKLINNFMSGVQAASLAEALSVIEKSGLDVRRAMTILMEGAPGSPIVKILGARMLEQDYQPNFLLKLMAKDLRYAAQEAKRFSLSLATGESALQVFDHAIKTGFGDRDMAAVVEQFRQHKC